MCPDGSQAWNVKDFHEYAHQEKCGAKPKMLAIFQWEFCLMFLPSRTIVEGLEFTGLEQIYFHIFWLILVNIGLIASNFIVEIVNADNF
jgi:hypothetical protein